MLNILLASDDIRFLHKTKNFLSIEMKYLGDVSFVLCIKIHQDRSRGILGLSEELYRKCAKKVWNAKL